VRRLTDQERIALRENGPPGEGPVNDETFRECIRMGWGFWGVPPEDWWHVTAAGRHTLELDDLARSSS
jgi:hypothetical protein